VSKNRSWMCWFQRGHAWNFFRLRTSGLESRRFTASFKSKFWAQRLLSPSHTARRVR